MDGDPMLKPQNDTKKINLLTIWSLKYNFDKLNVFDDFSYYCTVVTLQIKCYMITDAEHFLISNQLKN